MTHNIIWKETDEYIYGSTQKFKLLNKLALFDLDGTLITTKSGKKFPVDENDWTWNFRNIRQELLSFFNDGYSIFIISNQAGIEKKHQTSEEWCNKIQKIVDKLEINMQIFCSKGNNKYRKPFPTFFMKLITTYKLNPDYDKSFYCGDCAGRKNDRSDTDYKFALNCGIKFKTPEQIFCTNQNKSQNQLSISYPNLKSIRGTKFNFEPIDKEIIILVGLAGSGKSYIANYINKKFGHKIICKDVLKTKCMTIAKKNIEDGESIVIDSTNPDKITRKYWIDLGKEFGHTTRIISVLTDKSVAKHNNYYRHWKYGTKIVPDVAYNVFKSKYQEPSISEGVSEIISYHPDTPNDSQYFYYLY